MVLCAGHCCTNAARGRATSLPVYTQSIAMSLPAEFILMKMGAEYKPEPPSVPYDHAV